jgi:hypothetical protein|tara:strand:- start:171 stop:413 length:243 start_codon:yes stop_codon:yes gene_type:complete
MASTDINHYEYLQAMLLTAGWEELTGELEGMREILADVTHISGSDDLFYKKGQINIIDLLLRLPDTVSDALDDLQGVNDD